jgi:choline transport protein
MFQVGKFKLIGISVFSSGLSNGGPSGLVYGYLIVLVGTMFQTLTMAEMASMIPLSGGQYNW